MDNPPIAVSPPELLFLPPFTRVITNVLLLHNTSSKPVAYKVKTTARRRFCVRPNIGILQPNETADVQVMLNPKEAQDKEPSSAEKLKDKFLIQSIYVLPEQVGQDMKQVWAAVPEDQVIKQKLKCYYEKKPEKTHPAAPVFTPTLDTQTKKEEHHHHHIEHATIPSSPIHTSRAIPAEQAPPKHVEIREISDDEKPNEIEGEATNKLHAQLLKLSAERDEFFQEIQKLKEKLVQAEKEKEETLRQRKAQPVVEPKPTPPQPTPASTSTATNVALTSTKAMQMQQQKQQNQILMLILVAVIAFLLGRVL